MLAKPSDLQQVTIMVSKRFTLSFNLVECLGQTTRAISLTETRLGPWHSCRRITQSAAILCHHVA